METRMSESITIPAPAAVTPEPVVTPENTAAPAEKVQPSAEQVTPQASEPAGQDEQKKAATEESPEKELTAEERKRERNRERWREMNRTRDEALRRAQVAEAELQRIKSNPQRDYSQFQDPDERLAARTADMVRQSMAPDHEAQAAQMRAESDRAMREAWRIAQDDARARIPDFDQVVNDRTPIHQRAAPFIVESEKGPEIAYWLGKNPDAARDLYHKFESQPAQALLELGRIEARLSAPPPKTVSSAPKPAPVLNGGVSPLGFDPGKSGVDDFAAQLEKAGIIRKRA